MTNSNEHQHLRRLPPEYYRGNACVHWSLTIEGRKTGWLDSLFHCRFREVLTHTAFRYGFGCPIYCLMPDHVHLLWLGILGGCDQRNAMKYFRARLNCAVLAGGGVADDDDDNTRFQHQPYDHVLRNEERKMKAFERVAEYIARNPQRKGLVGSERHSDYSFTGCLLPGYPDLSPFQVDYWELFWRLYERMKIEGLTRSYGENEK